MARGSTAELVFLSLLIPLQLLDGLSRLSMDSEENSSWHSRDICVFLPCISGKHWFYPLPSRLPTRLADCSWLRALNGNLVWSHFNRTRKKNTSKVPDFICSDRTALKQHHHLIQTWVCHEFRIHGLSIVISKLVYRITPCRK